MNCCDLGSDNIENEISLSIWDPLRIYIDIG